MIDGVDTYDALVKNGERVVLANGCFDIFHAGHLEHLLEARKMGDRLIVALTIDSAVKKGPGRPINNWGDRAFLLRELRCVDAVVPSPGATAAIRTIKPAIFVKGIDYSGNDIWTEDVQAACREVGAELRFTKAPKQSAFDIIKKAMT